jgi:predicted O-linked N-acetylglucosamine transferase (SPINDLY family)
MTETTVDTALQAAIAHHRAGRWAEAEAVYRQILSQFPGHAAALHLLGVLAYRSNHVSAAIELIDRAIGVNPTVAEYHADLAEAYRRAGQMDAAIAAFRHAIALDPESAAAHYNLGNALKLQGRFEEAIAAYRRALELESDLALAHNNLGNALKATGRLAEAIVAYHRAIELEPGLALAHGNLGIALHEADQSEEAIAAHRRAIALGPDQALAYVNLGVALQGMDRTNEAIAVHRRAIALEPKLAEAHCNLGIALGSMGRFDEAIAAYREAIARKPDLPEAHNNLGEILRDQGQLDLALTAFRKAVELKPDYAGAASNFLFTLPFHPDFDARAILAEHRRWAERFAQPLAAEIQAHANDRTPDRRLRVGFLSPDLRVHPVGHLLLALWAHHDRQRIEIIAYSDLRVPDAVTDKLKASADQWHHTLGLSDAQVADRIRGDRIDILVDTTLHTARNRLLVFARKPAPIQVTMFGTPTTTGLPTMDYRLTDPYLDPPGAVDDAYTERSIRLPDCYWCYEASDWAPPVGELPARKKGHITFGCQNQFAKVSRPTLELWARILARVPGARLVIQSHPGSHLDPARRLFEACAITTDRVEFVPRMLKPQYFQSYGELDLCLDPFPYNGHTTTLDSLWMGVPVVTLAGRTAVGRGGVSILSNVGLTEMIARDPEEYVEIAVSLARDLGRLAELRAALRERIRASPLMNIEQFAADVESAFRGMWERWSAHA